MTILVSPLSSVLELVRSRRPSRVVSLLDSEFAFPDLGGEYLDRHLRLRFSTAAAYVACCWRNSGVSEHRIAEVLRGVAPLARPNETLVRLSDEALKRGGRMSAAIAETGRGLTWIELDEGVPFELPSVFDDTTSRLTRLDGLGTDAEADPPGAEACERGRSMWVARAALGDQIGRAVESRDVGA